MKKLFLPIAALLFAAFGFSQLAPLLIWHQTYGVPPFNQRVTAIAIDDADNLFLAGYEYFDSNGNILINKYDPLGNLKWNRMYTNATLAPNPDLVQYLIPDNQGGVLILGYLHRSVTEGLIFHYNQYGLQDKTTFFGDTTLGNTRPLAYAANSNSRFYALGQLNGANQVFSCDTAGNILWHTPVNNNYNPNAAQLSFDGTGNLIAAVFDSVSPSIRIRRYNAQTGAELPGFNTQIDSLPNDTLLRTAVDNNSNIFIVSASIDSGGHQQLAVHKFDTLGNALFTTLCPNGEGHLSIMSSLILDNDYQVLVSATYTDNVGTRQFAEVYKIDNDTGNILWSAADSAAFVNEGLVCTDVLNNVYMGTSKAQTFTSGYSELSFSRFSDSGLLQWNRSFDNADSNEVLRMVLNAYGDIFFASNTLTGTLGDWFVGRVGNAAGDVAGISDISKNENELTIYPNPFSSLTNVAFTAQQDGTGWLKIFNVEGQQLYTREIDFVNGPNQIQVNAPLSPGVYIFKLETAAGNAVQRAVVY